MDSIMLAKLGGTAGVVIGLLGGAVGTYFSIKNTQTPAERRFMIAASIVLWVAGLLLIALPMVLAFSGVIPRWSPWIPFAVFFIALGPMIRWANRRQSELRR